MNRERRLFAFLVVIGFWAPGVLAASLADMAPEGTLLYIAWPGADTYAGAIKDTEFSKLLAESEVMHFREMFRDKVWRVLREKMREDAAKEGGPASENFEPIMTILESAWRHPVVFSFIGVSPGEGFPKIDAMLLIRAGDDAKKVLGEVDRLVGMIAAEAKLSPAKELEIDGAKWKEISPPEGPSVRYGERGGDVLILVGQQVFDLLKAGESAKTLGKSERFQAAMKVTAGSDTSPVLYLDVRSLVKVFEQFAPALAAMKTPVIGEPDGVHKVLAAIGLETLESISAAMTPEQGGFKTTFFIRAPGVGKNASAMLVQKPLTDDDLRVVPQDASWAAVANVDLLSIYKGLMGSLAKLSPEIHSQATGMIQGLEKSLGIRVEEDVLGTLGDTWAIFDAPSNGSLLLTGITLVAEAKPANKLGDAMQALAGFVAGLADAGKQVSVRQETYRGATIHYVNVAAAPFPVAPAWAQQGEHWILAFYPQMVRIAIDRLIDKRDSILDNADFQHGRKLMPKQVDSISYTDTRSGVQSLYSIALPVAQMLIAMGQGEGMQIDATMMPSLSPILRHLFGEVTASASTDEGYVTVSYGSLPLNVGSYSGGSGAAGTALAMSVMLPSLARARELSKRTVSMTNLRQVGVAINMYASEHDKKLPPSLKALVEKGVIDEKVLKSPFAEGDEESYIFLGGDFENPQQIIAYEKPEHYQGEGTSVLYADGHVEFVKMEQFEKQLKAVKENSAKPSGEK